MSGEPVAPFGALLREKLEELDADEARQAWLAHDPIERFRLATQQVLLADHGNVMPRAGHHAYINPPQDDAEPKTRQLDILS